MKVMNDLFWVFSVEHLRGSTLRGCGEHLKLGITTPAVPFWCAARGEVA